MPALRSGDGDVDGRGEYQDHERDEHDLERADGEPLSATNHA